MQTDPDLQHAILTHLKGWRDDLDLLPESDLLLESILQSQAIIGWR